MFLNIDVIYWEHTNTIANYNNKYKMFIDNTISYRIQWLNFGHEIAHICWQGGSQTKLITNVLDYQESKADYFALHFYVSTFMLLDLKRVTAYDIVTSFNTKFDFTIRRLEMHRNKLIDKVELLCIAER